MGPEYSRGTRRYGNMIRREGKGGARPRRNKQLSSTSEKFCNEDESLNKKRHPSPHSIWPTRLHPNYEEDNSATRHSSKRYSNKAGLYDNRIIPGSRDCGPAIGS